MASEETLRMLEAVYQQDDKARADHERWQSEQLTKRSGDFGLVHKTFVTPMPQQQQVAVMDPLQQKGWDDWCRAHIRNAIAENYESVLKPVMGEVISELRGEWTDMICEEIGIAIARSQNEQDDQLTAKFNEEINKLRAEVEALRNELAEEKVLKWPRKRSDAA